MATTFKAVLKKKYKEDTSGIIQIRITQNRKSIYHSLKIKLPQRFWNVKRGEVRATNKGNEEINELINSKINQLKLKYGQEENIHTINKLSFTHYIQSQIATARLKGQHSTAKGYTSALSHLQSFNNGKDLLFTDITTKFVADFIDSLYELDNVTVKGYITNLRTLFNRAIKTNYYNSTSKPFQNINIKIQSKNIEYLNLEQLIKLKTHALVNDSYFPENIEALKFKTKDDLNYLDKKYLEICETRAIFFVQLYGQGLRFSDLATLKFKNIKYKNENSTIDFVQFKTKKAHSVHLNFDLLYNIYYLFDRDHHNQIFNDEEGYGIDLPSGKKWLTFTQMEQMARQYGQDIDIQLEEHKEDIYKLLLEKIQNKDNSDKFIVPLLNNNLFKNVDFTSTFKLNNKQLTNLNSGLKRYNRRLSDLKAYINTNINLTSHVVRHTFANLMLSQINDVYSISKALGHSNLSTTENYLSKFNSFKIKNDSAKAFDAIRL